MGTDGLKFKTKLQALNNKTYFIWRTYVHNNAVYHRVFYLGLRWRWGISKKLGCLD